MNFFAKIYDQHIHIKSPIKIEEEMSSNLYFVRLMGISKNVALHCESNVKSVYLTEMNKQNEVFIKKRKK